MPPIVQLSASKASSCVGAARWRLGYAVGASVVAHLAMFAALFEDAPIRAAAPGIARPLTVTLSVSEALPVARAAHRSDPVPETAAAHPPPALATRAPAAWAAEADSEAPAKVPGVASRAAVPLIVAAPAYYAAHELDVLPRLSEPLGPAPDGVPGHRMRLELLIDADGMVRKVSMLDADPSVAPAAAARSLWMAARFDPGRKAGRAVASRIQLEVSYGPPGAVR